MFYQTLMTEEERTLQQEVLKGSAEVRNVELDAANYDDAAEKCFTDEDMWKVHNR